MKKVLSLLSLLTLSISFSQIGINTNTPNSMIQVNGSFASNHKNVTENYTLTDKDFYVVYDNNTTTDPGAYLTLPNIPIDVTKNFKGRIYQIKNASKFPIEIRVSDTNNEKFRVGNSIGVSTFTLTAGSYTEIVHTGNSTNIVWDVMYISNPIITNTDNVTIKTAQLAIPPTNGYLADWSTENSVANTFNTDNSFLDISNAKWKVVSKTTKPFTRYTRNYIVIIVNYPYMVGYDLSSMDLTYEYTGTPLTATELLNVQPIITTGNNLSTHPDVFVASFYSIYTHVNGNTRINIKVTRADKIAYENPNNSYDDTPTGATSDWAGSFVMNLILAIKK